MSTAWGQQLPLLQLDGGTQFAFPMNSVWASTAGQLASSRLMCDHPSSWCPCLGYLLPLPERSLLSMPWKKEGHSKCTASSSYNTIQEKSLHGMKGKWNYTRTRYMWAPNHNKKWREAKGISLSPLLYTNYLDFL